MNIHNYFDFEFKIVIIIFELNNLNVKYNIIG